MIASLIGLQMATAMKYRATSGLLMHGSLSKYASMQRAQNATLLKMANAQEGYYKKLLDENIKRSFNIFA